MIKLDIVIPVYNEDENIIKLLQFIERELKHNFRILICYDTDNDTTLKHLKHNKIINSEILFIKNPKKGPNSAIVEGINYSSAEIILVYMADDFENVKLLNQMADLIIDGNDLVVPSRFIPGGKMLGAKKIKKAITIIGSYLIFYLGRIPFKDCTNAFKMFSASLKKQIKLESTTGFTFAMEITIKAFLLNKKIIEIPSTWKEAKNRKSNFKILKWIPYYIYWLTYSVAKKREKSQ